MRGVHQGPGNFLAQTRQADVEASLEGEGKAQPLIIAFCFKSVCGFLKRCLLISGL